jgi:hypothetical protein
VTYPIQAVFASEETLTEHILHADHHSCDAISRLSSKRLRTDHVPTASGDFPVEKVESLVGREGIDRQMRVVRAIVRPIRSGSSKTQHRYSWRLDIPTQPSDHVYLLRHRDPLVVQFR